jgi:nucleoside-diphosphate-sugar epimerase
VGANIRATGAPPHEALCGDSPTLGLGTLVSHSPDPSPARTRESVKGRVLVVGASGFLGRAVVRALAEDGFEVRGLARDAAKGERIRENGGIPFLGDILDTPSLASAIAGCTAAVHLAANPSREEDAMQVRVEGARWLVEAARSAGVSRLLIGSGYWVYRGQPKPIDEDAAVDPRGESRVNYETERVGLAAQTAGKLDVSVLRPGMVYGDGSWFRGMATAIRSGEYSVVGDGKNRWSFVALPDAGRAFATVLRFGLGGEVYNVVDGSPVMLREFVDFVAGKLGARAPPTIEVDAAAGVFGPEVAHHLAADRPTSNEKLCRLGWQPRFPSFREGLPPLLRTMYPHSSGRSD